MKTLPKSRRPRWRYLGVGVEAWPDAAFDRRALERALRESATTLLGDPGSAAVEPTVVGFALADGAGSATVRVRREELDRARAVVACVSTVEGHPVALRVRGVSGTMRACEERYFTGGDGAAEERNVGVDGDRRPATVRDDAVDVALSDGFVGLTTLDLHD